MTRREVPPVERSEIGRWACGVTVAWAVWLLVVLPVVVLLYVAGVR